jgi:hypothetical protein
MLVLLAVLLVFSTFKKSRITGALENGRNP